jgi:hypothetical protein
MGDTLSAIEGPPSSGAPLSTCLRIALVYWWRHRRWPDLRRPRRFTEWVQWRKLNDRRHSFALLTDKAYAKSIAGSRLGDDRVVPTLFLGDRLPAVAPWPMPFVVKANHGCRQSVVVRTARDYARARAAAPKWLAKAYGGLLDEWHYRSARRLLLVEPYIGGELLPLDYKVFVFGGRAEIVQLHIGRSRRHRWTQFDRDWNPLSDDPIAAAAPRQLAAMLAAAEAMASDEDFLRVDFYCEDGHLRFGECCLYPGSGLDPFRPDSLDLRLGQHWNDARRGAGPAATRPDII